jgi:hypothetical protein
MDEADVLCDRIAIISNGKLIAHGSSYFLKNKFGRGYYLTVSKNNTKTEIDSMRESSSSSDSGAGSLYTITDSDKTSTENSLKLDAQTKEEFEAEQMKLEDQLVKTLGLKDQRINEFIKTQLPNAILVQSIGTELTYSISNKKEYTKMYGKFFHELEANMPQLGISSIGLSDSTLEEVFIKLAKQPTNNSIKNTDKRICGINFTRIKEYLCACTCFSRKKYRRDELSLEEMKQYSEFTKTRVENKPQLVLQQFYALLIKRFHRVKRNIKGFFAEIVLPVVFVCLVI